MIDMDLEDLELEAELGEIELDEIDDPETGVEIERLMARVSAARDCGA